MGSPSWTRMGEPVTAFGDDDPLLLATGFLAIPRATSRDAYAFATAVDPLTVWATSADTSPLCHVEMNRAAAAEACARAERAEAVRTTTNPPAAISRATHVSATTTILRVFERAGEKVMAVVGWG